MFITRCPRCHGERVERKKVKGHPWHYYQCLNSECQLRGQSAISDIRAQVDFIAMPLFLMRPERPGSLTRIKDTDHNHHK